MNDALIAALEALIEKPGPLYHIPDPETWPQIEQARATLEVARATRAREENAELRAVLAWALDQIDDDLDPDHIEAMAAAHALLKRGAP